MSESEVRGERHSKFQIETEVVDKEFKLSVKFSDGFGSTIDIKGVKDSGEPVSFPKYLVLNEYETDALTDAITSAVRLALNTHCLERNQYLKLMQ